jgi:hypothetical protein
MRFVFFFLIAVSALPIFSAQAQVTQGLVRDPRSMAMGGTGVALADDEYALFNNPAGLADQETRRFTLIGLNLEASADTYSELSTSFSAFKNFDISTLNTLMGKNIALRADMIPMIQLPHFAITYLYDVQGSLLAFNRANPTFTLGDQITHGVQAAYGWSLQQSKHATDEVNFGVAGKVLWRKGGYYNISTAGFLQASTQGAQYVDNLIGNYGMGFGADAGFQYVNHVDKDTKLFFGSSITDIGNTNFSDPHAASIPMNISTGIGAEKKLEIVKIKVDFDLRNLSQQTDFVNKTHFGTELELPLFALDFGLNQMDITYGVSFDIWILKVSATSYAEEDGITFHQDTSRKYLLQVDFALPI